MNRSPRLLKRCLLAIACSHLLAASAHAQTGAQHGATSATNSSSATSIKPETSMSKFTQYTIESAPEGSGQALARLKQSAGLVPNLAAAMAESPALIDGFVTLREIYQRGTLTAQDREILGTANAVENRCEWCVAFHSFVAGKVGVPSATIEAIRASRPPEDARARALTRFTTQLIEQRGAIDSQELDKFLAAGFTKQQALEVVTGLAFSLMANYAGNFVEPQLDGFLAPTKWTAPAQR
jgi:uncharacterized peroxidase-related enzyme